MTSRVLRALLVVAAVVAGAIAAHLIRSLDAEIALNRASADEVREQARLLSATVAEMRAGQVSYVARGQSEDFWIAHVASLMPAFEKQTADFAASLSDPDARAAYEPASAALENFQALDRRVKEFVEGGNALLAADLIFSDGLESFTTANAQIAAALSAELQARSASIPALQARQLMIAGGAGSVVLAALLMLAFTGTASNKASEPEVVAMPPVEPVRFEAPLPKARPAVTPKLLSTAQLCSELARVVESRQLPTLLARASRVLDASGIIVWVADADGDLRPAVSHGYSDQALARMRAIPRDAANATAAAFRASELRTVTSDGTSSGALIVPLTTSDGCIGVLAAEMKAGTEKDESAQALATIFAAQLATIVAVPPAPQLKAAAQ